MNVKDPVAEWLVRLEEAVTTNKPAPGLDQLPPELRQRGREAIRRLRGIAGMTHGLAPTFPAPGDVTIDVPPTPPDTLRYRFELFLARGGMGEVWRGHDTMLLREVALKVMRVRVFEDALARVRFEEEARLVGQLEHPSIVAVYDL